MLLHFSPLERPGPLIGPSEGKKSEGSDNQKQEQGQSQNEQNQQNQQNSQSSDQQSSDQQKESSDEEPTASSAWAVVLFQSKSLILYPYTLLFSHFICFFWYYIIAVAGCNFCSLNC